MTGQQLKPQENLSARIAARVLAHDDEVDAVWQVPLEAAGHVLALYTARRAIVERVLRRRSRREGATDPIEGHAVVATGAVAARRYATAHHPCMATSGSSLRTQGPRP